MDKKRFLNFKRNNEKVLSIQQHYKYFVAPKASKFSRNDPSFGVIKGKDGVDRYHCFGCGVVGNFVDFYRGVEKIFNNRTLTEEQAIKEIAERNNIPLESLVVDTEQVELSREQQLHKFREIYTVADYERDIRKGLLMGRPIPYFNAKLLELISEGLVEENEM